MSSAPTRALKRSAPAAILMKRTLVARVPTPDANSRPPIRIGLPSMARLACATFCGGPPRPPPTICTRIFERSSDARKTSLVLRDAAAVATIAASIVIRIIDRVTGPPMGAWGEYCCARAT